MELNMSETPQLPPGIIAWSDLTVPNADEVRDFYSSVVGWMAAPVEMGDYQDYSMMSESSEQPIAGVCHKRGSNKNLPSQWLIYITVEDLDASIKSCNELGGSVVDGPRSMGGGARYCVIRDPAGAVAALYQVAGSDSMDSKRPH